MNRSIRGIITMVFLDSRISLMYFWSILFAVYAMVLFFLLQFKETQIITSGMSPLYIYILIAGIIVTREALPYALGMNVKRNDYYFGLLWGYTFIILGLTLFVTLLSRLERMIMEISERQFHFFYMPHFHNIGVFTEALSQFVFLFFFFALGMLIATLINRYGRMSMLVLGALVLLSITLLHMTGGTTQLFHWFLTLDSVLPFVFRLMPITILLLIVSYLLNRRVTI